MARARRSYRRTGSALALPDDPGVEMSESSVEEILQELKERGITTLEEFVQSEVRMREPQRVGVDEDVAADATPQPYRSTIGMPDPSVALVLDGKRVEYDAVAALSDRPLGYVPAALEGGKQALVIYSDPAIVNGRGAGRARESSDPTVGAARTLASVGLRPAVARDGRDIGIRIYKNNFFGGSWAALAPEWYIADLRDFRAGLGIFDGNWGDKISSVQVMSRCRWQGWEMKDRGGAWIKGGSWEELDSVGWNDDISSIETWFVQ
jgi:hypothetical protein